MLDSDILAVQYQTFVRNATNLRNMSKLCPVMPGTIPDVRYFVSTSLL
jgi:hypothetical protein